MGLSCFGVETKITVGLGLYVLFGANGQPIPEFNSYITLAYGVVAVGAAFLVWSFVRMLMLFKKRSQLEGQ